MERRSPLDREVLGRTFWEWMQVLIVPFAIALFTIVFSVVQSCSQQRIEEQRSQDEALQAYLGAMTDLLLKEELASSEPDSVESTLARSRTLSTLDQLDGDHKRTVVIFLSEASLIWKGTPGTQAADMYPIVD